MARLRRPERLLLQDEKRTAVARLLGYACLVPSTCGVLFLSGCSGFNDAISYDPLLGGPPLRPSVAATPAPPTPAPVALPTAPNSTLSPAALAAGAPRPVDNGRDLRTGSAPVAPANDGWARQGLASNNSASAITPTVGGSGAILRTPEPITQQPPLQQPSPVAGTASPRESGITTYEQAQAKIKQRGALWQELKMVAETGEWTFRCSIPNRQNPAIRRTYEATASDSLAAIRAVLEQLDKDQ
jgi:hypothetical protein